MQIAVVEFARHVAGMDGANSTEFDPETPYPVIDLLPEQKEVSDLGGTMRLGADPVKLHDGTRAREIYGEAVIYKRHRHRYEVNNHACASGSRTAGLVVSRHLAGRAPGRGDRAAATTRSSSPRSSTPSSSRAPSGPEPLFREFVAAALDRARERSGDVPEGGAVRASRSAAA